jgi:hypothetical protein
MPADFAAIRTPDQRMRVFIGSVKLQSTASGGVTVLVCSGEEGPI